MSQEIIKVLEYLSNKIGITIDWTNNNILPQVKQLCEKLVLWECNTSIAWIIIMVALTILALLLAIFVDWDKMEWVIFGVVVLFTIVVIGCQAFDIIECKVFPEKTIYDYIQHIMRMQT